MNAIEKRNTWLKVNSLTLKEVKREANHALRLRALANRTEKEDRALWINNKTRNRKVV